MSMQVAVGAAVVVVDMVRNGCSIQAPALQSEERVDVIYVLVLLEYTESTPGWHQHGVYRGARHRRRNPDKSIGKWNRQRSIKEC